jgi:hypothetical protein
VAINSATDIGTGVPHQGGGPLIATRAQVRPQSVTEDNTNPR